jgi:MazG family protein
MNQNENGRWQGLGRIWEIIDRLRGDSGCPWDRKQTPESVQTYLIEEAHEAAAAVRTGHAEDAAEELGDLLFMVFFLTHLYEEQGSFRLEDVCELICSKMIRRHPHVFGDASVQSVQEVKDNWEKIKADEKASADRPTEGVPESLPALMRAYRTLSRLAQKEEAGGLNDFESQTRKFTALSENLLARAATGNLPARTEIGDLLLTIVNLARIGGYRAEDCLHDQLRSIEKPH